MEKILSQSTVLQDWRPTGRTKELYAELSESIVRQAVSWLDADGHLIDPFEPDPSVNFGPKGFAPFATVRFVGALGFLIETGRCKDLIDVCAKSLETSCGDLFNSHARPVRGVMFYAKELMRGYLALKDKMDHDTVERWKHLLGGYDPEKTYASVPYHFKEQPSWRKRDYLANCLTFALAGEGLKKQYGIADNDAWIEKYLEYQLENFTDYGMYLEPNHPLTYDWTPRMNLSILRHSGYDGRFAAELDETLRRGALTTLLYLSSAGEAPYGGRSNQQNFNEATIAVICEYEAIRYKKLGDMTLAGAFKRAARLATLSTKRWLDMRPVRFTKNGFPPDSQHGRQSDYGLYGLYSLLIASQLGFAHMIADDSIEEAPSPAEVGGYVFQIPEPFHKVFATGQGYHVEIDTRADHHYDATGLGRLHHVSAPTETMLSTPIVSDPSYLVSTAPSPRAVAIGPGWETANGETRWLSDHSDEIEAVEVELLKENVEEVAFKVVYSGKFTDCQRVVESYKLTDKGLNVEDEVDASTNAILAQVPVIKTDGDQHSHIEVNDAGVTVTYRGHNYTLQSLEPSSAKISLESFSAPNKNGVYVVARVKAKRRRLAYTLSVARNSHENDDQSQSG